MADTVARETGTATAGPKKSAAGSPRRRIWTIVKWTLCVVVFTYVCKRGYDLWHESGETPIEFHTSWLVLSGVVYLAAWLPSVWVWRELMHSLGETVSFADTARAYYCGHLGKYVPGKVLVPVIRGKMMQERGAHFVPAALTAIYETLLMMGAGLAIGLALLPTTGWPKWLSEMVSHDAIPPIVVGVGCILLLPVISKLLTVIALRTAPAEFREAGRSMRISKRLIAISLAAFVLTWVFQGLSLGLTLRATGDAFNWSHWPVWTGATSISTSVGFLLLFAPGGVGVREGLLMEVLRFQPDITEKQAIAAAVLTRLVSLFAEIAAAVVLYYLVRPKPVHRKPD